jgi:FHS family L-fucose permease-like MFS transporter
VLSPAVLRQPLVKDANVFTTKDGRRHTLTFALVCLLFLLSGLCNGMIDVLNKHFQNSLGINKAQSAYVQAAWYAAYFFMALPAGWVARRWGYRGGILTGLIVVMIGSCLFVPVTSLAGGNMLVFVAFLAVLFLVGSGLTFLETVANPYTTVLGSEEAAVARINLAQSCNAIGWIIGPILGSACILSKTETINTSNASLYIPYLIVAGIVAVQVVVFLLAPIPDLQAPDDHRATAERGRPQRSLFRERHFTAALVSQFLYVAGQTGIFSFFINYVKDERFMPALPAWLAAQLGDNMKYMKDGDWYLTEYAAGLLLSGAFCFFTAGRFSGSWMVKRFSPPLILGIYALINVVLMLLVCLGLGWTSVLALILCFYFMSIMYPTNFALAIRGLGDRTKQASSFMVTAIVGGAVMPILMGWMADHWGMGVGFLMPMACFAYIAFFGFRWPRWYERDMATIPA